MSTALGYALGQPDLGLTPEERAAKKEAEERWLAEKLRGIREGIYTPSTPEDMYRRAIAGDPVAREAVAKLGARLIEPQIARTSSLPRALPLEAAEAGLSTPSQVSMTEEMPARNVGRFFETRRKGLEDRPWMTEQPPSPPVDRVVPSPVGPWPLQREVTLPPQMQTVARNAFIDQWDLQKEAYDLERARMAQAQLAAEINPQTREGAELARISAEAGLLGKQGELAGAQAEKIGETPEETAVGRSYLPLMNAMMDRRSPYHQVALQMQQAKIVEILQRIKRPVQSLTPQERKMIEAQALQEVAREMDQTLALASARYGMGMGYGQ